MKCISTYLWELREVHKKIQNEPLTKEEQEEIIRAYNQVVNLCRTADTRGIEIFDMQRMKFSQMNCERILFEFTGYVANYTISGLFEEAHFHAYLHLRSPQRMDNSTSRVKKMNTEDPVLFENRIRVSSESET